MANTFDISDESYWRGGWPVVTGDPVLGDTSEETYWRWGLPVITYTASGLHVADVTTDAALGLVVATDVPTTGAVTQNAGVSVPTDGLLTVVGGTNVSTDSTVTQGGTRDLGTDGALTTTITRDVVSDSSVSRDASNDMPTTGSLSTVATRIVGTDAIIHPPPQTVMRDIGTDAAISVGYWMLVSGILVFIEQDNSQAATGVSSIIALPGGVVVQR